MILNNSGLTNYISNAPNTALLRISPNIQFVDIALNLCRYAKSMDISFVVQVTPDEVSENIKEQAGIQYMIVSSIVDELIALLDSEDFIVYVPNLIDNLHSNIDFESVELSDLAKSQKYKFRDCFTMLDYSYSGFVKPFKKSCVFAIEGIENILFWILERTVYLRNVVGTTREPIFINTIERNIYGLPITSNNLTYENTLINHKEHNIENAVDIFNEYSILHTKTDTIIHGGQSGLTHFSHSFPFNKISFSGYPLPEGVVLHEVTYTAKSKHRYSFSDIILEGVI